jgi:hypothetical protein
MNVYSPPTSPEASGSVAGSVLSLSSSNDSDSNSNISIGSEDFHHEEVFRSEDGWKITPPSSPFHGPEDAYYADDGLQEDNYEPERASGGKADGGTERSYELSGHTQPEPVAATLAVLASNSSSDAARNASSDAASSYSANIVASTAVSQQPPATSITSGGPSLSGWCSAAATLAALCSASALIQQQRRLGQQRITIGRRRLRSAEQQQQHQQQQQQHEQQLLVQRECWAGKLRDALEERDEERVRLEGYARQFKSWHEKQEGALARTEAALGVKDVVITQIATEVASLEERLTESGQIFEDLLDKKERSLGKTQRDLIRAHTQIHFLRIKNEALLAQQRERKKGMSAFAGSDPLVMPFADFGFGSAPAGPFWRPKL